MIGRLRGSLADLDGTAALIDVGGVGYEVDVTTSAAAALAAAPHDATLFTHLVAREDAQTLYGFAATAERDLFRTLIKVSGVGPRLALALLSSVTPDEFATAIASGNAAALTRVPGIGKKTAERLAVELRDKVDAAVASSATGGGAAREAVLALVALGYREREAAAAVGPVAEAAGAEAPVETLIRDALRALAA